MEFYDAHIHFFFTSPPEELKEVFPRLTKTGLAGFDALFIAEFPGDIEKVLKMIPAFVQDRISIPALKLQEDPFPYLKWAEPLKIIPFADVRFMEQDVEEKVIRFKERGFLGLKLLYIPEEDKSIQVQGMEQAFGRSPGKSEELTARLIDSASSLGMCILFHVDLRRYGDFATEMLRSYGRTNFNIPHFGSSRKALVRLLEKYDNCYTDLSSLVPFMAQDPQSYREFIYEYQDRILFGSDALIGNPEQVESAWEGVARLLDNEEILHKVASANYLSFHGPGSGPSS